MKNSDKPSYPQSNNEIVSAFLEVEEEAPNGLTKREAFAMAAMQGLLSSEMGHVTSSAEISDRSIHLADTLLAALDK